MKGSTMNRRRLLQQLASIPFFLLASRRLRGLTQTGTPAAPIVRRVRPSDPHWPSIAKWEKLKRDVSGRLISVESPLAACKPASDGAFCESTLKLLKNPYYLGDQPGLTESSGWLDAWRSSPSVYAVTARETADVVAGVNFARENNLRLVVKGGGHSYQGTSNAADSLLIWTRAMNGVVLHDSFVARGCEGKQTPEPAVTIGPGAIWMHAYDAVTTKSGRYVQGGGCATVGVAGLIQGGGFGSFSKRYGMAAAALLEAEVVTADGEVRIANACTHPDLFWGIKGGGSSLGVLTKLTLRTRDLPAFFGAVVVTAKATTDATFRKLIREFLRFYSDSLYNPHWGESVTFHSDNSLTVGMVFQGLEEHQAKDVWQPFFEWLAKSPQDFQLAAAPIILGVPARNFWNPEYIRKNLPNAILADDRPGAPANDVFWSGNLGEAGVFWHGYESVWLPNSLLKEEGQSQLAEAVFAGTRFWDVAFHFNKGLAGAPAEVIADAKDTAINPAVLDAFALAIVAGGGSPAFPGISDHDPDLAAARKNAIAINKATNELRKLVPSADSYVSESNYFEKSWQRSFWGDNYERLLSVKRRYDPNGLFYVHHGVGSEDWSADGFERVAGS
jgi:FAD/FMN-containing dehydrogenase